MRNSWWYYLHKSISRDTILNFITGDNYVKAIYLGPLSSGNYLELIISSQLFCGAMVWALIVQGLIIWGAITWEATFFLGRGGRRSYLGGNYLGGHLSGRGQLSWGTVARRAIILRGNYPWGNRPFPKICFCFLRK